MQHSKFVVGAIGGAAAVVALGGLGTYLLSGTESTTGLDSAGTVMVDGHKALAPNIVTGRIQSKYHPLPWVGKKVSVTCPTGLKAVAGATVTCVGKESDGKSVDIPVSVVKAGADSVTWKFER
ncbi:DUF4333 domain-containing protein [Streptomyces sp. NBC_01235]|uniref:DUF4333 domain-containing protein n=1 Tax=Streptomyces sp. NBC_01235 TaxID=2903788 RepID=UPI002E12B359|nr:DUF4333 domain-containing protein [Streptomyces sp. NBC_01235]